MEGDILLKFPKKLYSKTEKYKPILDSTKKRSWTWRDWDIYSPFQH